jgi:hypothetical protein
MSLSKRILLDSIFIIGIIFLPWYILAIAALLLYWKFQLIEIIGFGLLMDIVYGSDALHVSWLGWIPFLPFAYGALIAVAVLSLIKKRIR